MYQFAPPPNLDNHWLHGSLKCPDLDPKKGPYAGLACLKRSNSNDLHSYRSLIWPRTSYIFVWLTQQNVLSSANP